MTHYSDLTEYSYSDFGRPALNVGWLSPVHEFPVGDASEELVDALVRLAAEKVNVYRGIHFCELCPTFTEAQSHTYVNGVFVGSGEIRVKGEGQMLYASPAMIAHYVKHHHYAPPAEFCKSAIEAVDRDGL
ncbi:hypothetical protein [Streptomyces sp. NEAU-L66]|uniref:DUF7919 family protein n=1 Tax=Streptomyces sp. NEAU-L66 TaxID=3390812 RepID=UPI0039C639FB